MRCIYYFKNRNQCVTINHAYSHLDITSGVSKASIACSILPDILFNDVLYFLLIAAAHNNADGNTLTSYGKILEDLVATLKRSDVDLI